MTLEWLRRHDPVLDQHLRTYLFTEGSITEIEHEAEHEDGDASEQPVAQHRKPERGGSAVNHLFRELAPITAAGWAAIEEEAEPDAAHLSRRPQAGRLLRAARLGGLRRSTSAGSRRSSPRTPTSALRCARSSRSSSCAPTSRSRAPSSTRSSGAASHPDLDPVRDAAVRLAEAEDKAIFHGFGAAGIQGLSEASEHARGLDPRRLRGLPAAGRQGGRARCGPRASTVRTRSRSARAATPAWSRRPQGGYPVLNHIRMILDGPIIWAPGGRRRDRR